MNEDLDPVTATALKKAVDSRFGRKVILGSVAEATSLARLLAHRTGRRHAVRRFRDRRGDLIGTSTPGWEWTYFEIAEVGA